MNQAIFVLLTIGFVSCNQRTDNNRVMQSRIDSLENKLENAYKPGLGEFMSSIQVHHNKLWFAGQNENWKLADFEIQEIKEAVEAIEKYQTEREESKMVRMLKPALDSMGISIQRKNRTAFKSNYVLLTSTCNKCHRAVNFEFNVVKIPEAPPFSNQDFKVLSK